MVQRGRRTSSHKFLGRCPYSTPPPSAYHQKSDRYTSERKLRGKYLTVYREGLRHGSLIAERPGLEVFLEVSPSPPLTTALYGQDDGTPPVASSIHKEYV